MQRITFYSLLVVCSVFLASCSIITESSKTNKQHAVTIHVVEFYSRAIVNTVEVALYEFGTTNKIGQFPTASDGTVTFKNLHNNQDYTIEIIREINGVLENQSTHTFTFNDKQADFFVETYYPNAENGLAVPITLQNPSLPNGCEITALTAILNYYGEDVSKDTMNTKYLKKQKMYEKNGLLIGPDPNKAFAGDPTKKKNAFYVYPSPIVKAANAYLTKHRVEHEAFDITGASEKELREYLKKGIPILAWVTIDLKKAETTRFWQIEGTTKKHSIYRNLHAVVISEISKDSVTIMNPLKGYEVIPLKTFLKSYQSLGNMAVVVH